MYIRSPIRFMTRPKREKKNSGPNITGDSRAKADSKPSKPRPSSEKMISINREPVNKMPTKAGSLAPTVSRSGMFLRTHRWISEAPCGTK